MLAASPELYYVHEPFNPSCSGRDDLGRLRFTQHFTYITSENESTYRPGVQRILEGRYDLLHALLSCRRRSQLRTVLANRKAFADRRRDGIVPLIKDPIALMSAGWLARSFGLQCVVTIRHPGAFVASIKRLGWDSKPFNWALSQPLLMRDFLQPFEAELRELETGDSDVIERAAMAWKLHHYVIKQYKDTFDDWIFLRHEDISQDPVEQFRRVYEKLSLTWTDKVEETIRSHSSSTNPKEAEGKDKPLHLDSRAAAHGWKDRLEADEVERIRARVDGVVQAFYGDSEWL